MNAQIIYTKFNFIGQLYQQSSKTSMKNHTTQDILVDVFALVSHKGCKKQQKASLERRILRSIDENDGIFCSICRKDINRIIFIYEGEQYYCLNCFDRGKDLRNHLCVYVDRPIIPLSQQYGEMHPREQCKKIQSDCSKEEKRQELEEKQQNLAIEKLRNQFWMANTDILDFIAGEVHNESKKQQKEFIQKQMFYLCKQREQIGKIIKKTIKNRSKRGFQANLPYYDQSNMSDSEGSSVGIQQVREKSKQIMRQIDNLLQQQMIDVQQSGQIR